MCMRGEFWELISSSENASRMGGYGKLGMSETRKRP